MGAALSAGLLSGVRLSSKSPHWAPACVCTSRGPGNTVADTVAFYFHNAHVVVRGVVLSHVLVPDGRGWLHLASGDSIPNGSIVTTIAVLRHWKGDVPDTLTFPYRRSALVMSSCDYTLDVGVEYLLFFRRRSDGQLFSDYCTGTRWTYRNEALIRALDALASRP